MPLPSTISDLSTTPALNSPAGSESPALVDDYLRTHAAFIKQVSDSKDTLDAANVKLTGNQTIAGTKTFSSAPVVPGLNGGQLAGMRNKIINGKMEIAQRGTSINMGGTLGTPVYTLDRWFAVQLSALSTTTITQQASVGPNDEFFNALRVQRASGQTGVSTNFVGQQIEFANFRDLRTKQCTLSFWARAGANYSASGGNLGLSAYTGTVADQASSNGVNGTFTGQATILSQNVTLTTSWQRFTATLTPATGTGVLQILFLHSCTGTAGANDWFEITGVQLEVGSVATPFEHRPYGAELALCQRYYWKNVDGGSTISLFGSGVMTGINTAEIYIGLPVSMRAVPTFSYGNVQVITGSSSLAISSTVAQRNTTSSLGLILNTAAGTTGHGAALRSASSASGFVDASSEL